MLAVLANNTSLQIETQKWWSIHHITFHWKSGTYWYSTMENHVYICGNNYTTSTSTNDTSYLYFPNSLSIWFCMSSLFYKNILYIVRPNCELKNQNWRGYIGSTNESTALSQERYCHIISLWDSTIGITYSTYTW